MESNEDESLIGGSERGVGGTNEEIGENLVERRNIDEVDDYVFRHPHPGRKRRRCRRNGCVYTCPKPAAKSCCLGCRDGVFGEDGLIKHGDACKRENFFEYKAQHHKMMNDWWLEDLVRKRSRAGSRKRFVELHYANYDVVYHDPLATDWHHIVRPGCTIL